MKALVSIKTIVRKWILDGIVEGVVDKGRKNIELEELDIMDWALQVRTIIRKKEKKVETQVIIRVIITKTSRGLIRGYKKVILEESIRLEIKITDNEHTVKVRLIIGVNLRFAVKK